MKSVRNSVQKAFVRHLGAGLLSLAVVLLSGAAVAAEAVPEEAAGDWISGSTLVTILTVICGGGGIAIGRQAGLRRGREEAERRVVSGKVDVPQPLTHEQSAYQAAQKENASDHTNIFGRISGLEQRVSAVEAKVDAKFESIKDQLTETNSMVRQLVERICKGRK